LRRKGRRGFDTSLLAARSFITSKPGFTPRRMRNALPGTIKAKVMEPEEKSARPQNDTEGNGLMEGCTGAKVFPTLSPQNSMAAGWK